MDYAKIMEALKSMSIRELELSIRSINVLNKNNISCVANLVTLTRDEVASMKGAGRKVVKEIETSLRERGLDFSLVKQEDLNEIRKTSVMLSLIASESGGVQ